MGKSFLRESDDEGPGGVQGSLGEDAPIRYHTVVSDQTLTGAATARISSQVCSTDSAVPLSEHAMIRKTTWKAMWMCAGLGGLVMWGAGLLAARVYPYWVEKHHGQ